MDAQTKTYRPLWVRGSRVVVGDWVVLPGGTVLWVYEVEDSPWASVLRGRMAFHEERGTDRLAKDLFEVYVPGGEDVLRVGHETPTPLSGEEEDMVKSDD